MIKLEQFDNYMHKLFKCGDEKDCIFYDELHKSLIMSMGYGELNVAYEEIQETYA